MKIIKYTLRILFVNVIILLMCTVSAVDTFAEEEVTDMQNNSISLQEITMQYDDYFTDVSYSTVEIISQSEPESYKVGYGVEQGTKDDAVVEAENGVLHAVGIGTATVMLDEVQYNVTVQAAPISLFLMIGQSNMYGLQGDAGQSVVNKNGTVYSTVGIASYLTQENAAQYVPSALSGEGAKVNVLGTEDGLCERPVNSLTDSGDGKIGLDSAFAKRWYEITGEKVWLINAAHTGKAISSWIKGGTEYNEAVALFKVVQQVMQNEILAGHYVLSEYGYFWLQGCSDRDNTAEYYVQNFLSMHSDLKKELAFDFDADGKKEEFEFGDVLMPRAGYDDCVGYRCGVYTDSTDVKYEQSFYDLEMRGPRVALYWLVNNPEYEDINLVCNIGDRWAVMPDGSNGVREYFTERYNDGRVDYITQKTQNDEWYTPSTVEDVHDNVHYNQIGYNELGFEAAQNAAYTHGKVEKPEDINRTVTFYDWTGYREVSSIDACEWADSGTLVVPVVYPVWESKNVTYAYSDNLEYKYYDLTAKKAEEGGTLVSEGAYKNKTVTVSYDNPYILGKNAYYFDGTSNGLKQTGSELYSSNSITSVTTGDGKGTVENGVHSNMAYMFEKTVNLCHDKQWSVEWSGKAAQKSETKQSFKILSEYIYTSRGSQTETNYLWRSYDPTNGRMYITLGTNFRYTGNYSNESILVSKYISNPDDTHVYRMFNEINEDGTNRICLSIDGIFCGEFKNYSGKDFRFRFIGAYNYTIDNYIFDYFKILEDSYCDIYGHSYSEVITEATCQNKGYVSDKCVCGDIISQNALPKLEHAFSDFASDSNATYTSDGTKTATCTKCTSTRTVTDKGSKLKLGYPDKLSATQDMSSITLSWKSVKGARGYRVYEYIGGKWKVLVKATSKTEYTFSSLSASSKHRYAVKAYVSEAGQVIWGKKYTDIITATMPSAPNVYSTEPNFGTVKLYWDKIDNITGYRVYKSNTQTGKWDIAVRSTRLLYTVLNDLTAGESYIYAVRAYINTGDCIVWSPYTQINISAVQTSPKLRVASTAKGRATLAWSEYENATGYQVYYSENPSRGFKKVANYKPQTLKTYITSLDSSKTYYFKVRAYKKTETGYVYSGFSDVKMLKVK